MGVVKDKHVEAALDYFNAQPHPSATAKYNSLVTETAAKAAYAKAFLAASGTVKERECIAELDPEYQAAKAAEADAAFEEAIGAMTRHAEVAGSAEVKKAIPALAALAGTIADRQVRNMGTLGGSLANNDPAADSPAAVLGLNATITTTKGTHAADKFFKGLYETAIKPGEIITSVSFPVPKRAAYMKFKNQASRFAIVGVFVADTGAGVRDAVTGAAPCVLRLVEFEKALTAKFAPESVANLKVKPDGLNSDLHASAEYRAHLITVMARRAVEAALK